MNLTKNRHPLLRTMHRHRIILLKLHVCSRMPRASPEILANGLGRWDEGEMEREGWRENGEQRCWEEKDGANTMPVGGGGVPGRCRDPETKSRRRGGGCPGSWVVNGAKCCLIWAGRLISSSGAEAGGMGGSGWAGLAQLSSQGARGWEPDCGGFTECGRWEEEAADVGHLFWKFGSKGGRTEVAPPRERFLVLNLFVFKYRGQRGCLFFQNEGSLGVLEAAASENPEVKTLKTVMIPGNQTPSVEYSGGTGAGNGAASTGPWTGSLSAETRRL